MCRRALALLFVAASLVACGDPAPTSPAALAGEVLIASRAELSADAPAAVSATPAAAPAK